MRRTSARRAGAVAVFAAGAVLLSGCGSSDDSGGKDKADKPEPSASETPSKTEKPDPSGEASDGAPDGAADDGQDGGSGAGGGSGKKLSGVWKAKGKQYVITVVGDKVTLLRERGRNCTGTLDAGRTVDLKCPSGGDQSRTNGTFGELKGKTLTVSWKGGPTETYARVTDVPVKLPESPES